MEKRQKRLLALTLFFGSIALTICLFVVIGKLNMYLIHEYPWKTFTLFNMSVLNIIPFVLPFLPAGILVGFYIKKWSEGVRYLALLFHFYVILFAAFIHRVLTSPYIGKNATGLLLSVFVAIPLYFVCYTSVWIIRSVFSSCDIKVIYRRQKIGLLLSYIITFILILALLLGALSMLNYIMHLSVFLLTPFLLFGVFVGCLTDGWKKSLKFAALLSIYFIGMLYIFRQTNQLTATQLGTDFILSIIQYYAFPLLLCLGTYFSSVRFIYLIKRSLYNRKRINEIPIV